MSFPKYPAYKDSGVQWLGEVPEHWSVGSFKRQIERNDGGVWGDEPDGINDTIVLRSTEQTADGHWQVTDPAVRKLTAAEINGSLLAEGDLLLTKSSGSSLHIGKTTLVTAEISALQCCYSNFMQRIRLRHSFLPKLAWYLMNNDLARRQFDLLSNSSTGLANLNATMVGQIDVPIPPFEEQTTIAAFLDRETAKIDALVAEQEKLVALLKEKRQSVISHAVTKGLDPSAPMKYSGVEWLGEVPAHWYVTPLRWLLSTPVTNGIFKKKDDFGKGVLLVNVFDIYRDDYRINYVSLDKVDCTLDEQRAYEVSEGDLFFVRSSLKREGVAVVAVADQIDESVVFECHLIRARPKSSKLQGRFASYVLNSAAYKARLVSLAKVTTMTTIDQEAIKSVEIVCPPIAEQRAIAQYLDDATKSFDLMTREAKSAIALLQERRTALISAAVTGQIDVRHLATA